MVSVVRPRCGSMGDRGAHGSAARRPPDGDALETSTTARQHRSLRVARRARCWPLPPRRWRLRSWWWARGLGQLSGAVLSSVSGTRRREAPCPVVVAPSDGTANAEDLASGKGRERGRGRAVRRRGERRRDLRRRGRRVDERARDAAHGCPWARAAQRGPRERTGRCAWTSPRGSNNRAASARDAAAGLDGLQHAPAVQGRLRRRDAGDQLRGLAHEDRTGLVVVGTRGRGPCAPLCSAPSRRSSSATAACRSWCAGGADC